MEVTITNIQPNPISVLTGHTEVLRVSTLSSKQFENARLVITNKQPAGADLFDSDETGDQIRSDPKLIQIGSNNLTHEIGFTLQEANTTHGAIIGIEVYIEDETGTQISTKVPLLAVIGGVAT